MFESSGETPDPCPVPFSSTVRTPSSRMPARTHFGRSRMMRLSPIRCSRKRTTHCWETSVKNDRMSASSMKFTFLLLIPTISASSASCWLRFWPKSIREPEEILLVDRAQHRCHGSLDDFVFERRDRERALASVFLRNVAPTGRQRPVRSCLDPRVQCLDPTIEVLLVGLPCHAVHAGCSVSLHRVKRCSQHGGIDMVQERGEPLLLPSPCDLPYAFQRL